MPVISSSIRLMVSVSNGGEIKSRADLILEANKAIRYVAMIDYSNKVIECKGHGAFSLNFPQRKLESSFPLDRYSS